MIKFKQIVIRTIAFLLTVLMLAGMTPAVSAAEVSSPMTAELSASVSEGADAYALFEKLKSESIILKTGSPYYYKNGVKAFFNRDNKSYYPKYSENDIFVTPAVLNNMFECNVSYSGAQGKFTVKKDDLTAEIRVGEDAVYVNGVGRFIQNYAEFNGKGNYLPVTVIASALGYDVRLSGNIIVINNGGSLKLAEPNEDLSNLYVTVRTDEDFSVLSTGSDGSLYRTGYSFYDWGDKDSFVPEWGYTDEKAKSGYSVYLGATQRSFMGIQQTGDKMVNLDKMAYAYRIDFSACVSEDYAGNKPVVVVLFYNNNSYTGSEFMNLDTEPGQEWKNYSLLLTRDKFTERNANKFAVVLATQRPNDETVPASGYIYYDELHVEEYSQTSTVLKQSLGLMDGLFSDYVYTQSFEDGEAQMTFFDWGHRSDVKATTVEADDAVKGKKYGSMKALPSSYAAYKSPSVYRPDYPIGYEISFWAKCSEDYASNRPNAWVEFYNDGRYIAQVSTIADSTNALSTEWSKFTFYRPYRDWDCTEWDANSIVFIIGTEAKGVSETAPAAGTLYIDDITVKAMTSLNGFANITFSYDDEYSWYNLGDKVTYKADRPELLAPYSQFLAKVYDIDGELVHSELKSEKDVRSEGFSYRPTEQGWYEFEITAYADDGYEYPVVSAYSGKFQDYYTKDYIARRRGFVVTGETKPMDERSDYFMISSRCNDQVELHVANLIGFSGVRIHNINWGDTAGSGRWTGGFHDGPGVFDWTNSDDQIGACVKEGFRNIVPNIFKTPYWTLSDEAKKETGANTGMYNYNKYAPVNRDATREGFTAFTERYKDVISGIELWNEPYYGTSRTAFWYDTTENWEQLQIDAAEAIKSVDPDMEIWSAGHLASTGGAVFFGETMENEELKKYVDVVSHHGTYNTTDMFRQMMEAHDMTDRKVINSESYSYTDTPVRVGEPKDFLRANMKWIMHNLYQMKQGVYADCYFEVRDNDSTVQAENGTKGEYGYGVYKTYPYDEPYSGCSVMHTFCDVMGREFEFLGEYDFGNVKGVRFMNNGEPLVIFWNTKLEDFEMPEQLKDLMTDESTLIDFEGKTVSADGTLKKQKCFYLRGIDAEALDAIAYTADAALNTDYADPYYTAENMKVVVDDLDSLDKSLPIMDNAKEKPFDEKTFTLNENVEWNENDWKWVSRSGDPIEGTTVRHSIHVDEDGVYILVDVTDSTYYNDQTQETVSNLWQGDSLQFAINTSLDNSGNGRLECQAALTKEGVLLYKEASQDVGAMIPIDFTYAGKLMPKEYASITRTETGLMYMIFVPVSELFPYVYPGPANFMRISLLVNNTNDSKGSLGGYEWGSGIHGGKNVTKYGIVKYAELDDTSENTEAEEAQ